MKPRTVKVLVAAVVIILVAAACSGTADTSSTTQPSGDGSGNLKGTRWVATGLFAGGAAVPLVPGTGVSLEFDDAGTSASGATGCNSFFATVRVGGGSIAFGQIGQTEIGCQPPLMRQEQNVIRVLSGAETFSITGGVLTLGDRAGSALEMIPRAEAFPGASLTGTLWVADTVITGDAASTVVQGVEVSLLLDAAASTASGSTGCNSFSGSFESSEREVTFGPIAVTEIGCQGAGIMEQEGFVISVLTGELRYEIDGSRLTLLAANGDGLGFVATP